MTDDFPHMDEHGRKCRLETDEEGRTVRIYPKRYARDASVQAYTARPSVRRQKPS
jgi:hypothetical protein